VHANQPRVIPNIAVCGRNVDASWRARNRDSKTAAALDQRFDGVITTETDLRKIVGPANRCSPARFSIDSIADVGTSSPRRHSLWWAQPIRSAWWICRRRAIARDSSDVLTIRPLPFRTGAGNRRVDTFQNLLQNPGVRLILLFRVNATRFALPFVERPLV
jgi:hypothetical protein